MHCKKDNWETGGVRSTGTVYICNESREKIIFSSSKDVHMKAFWHLSDQIREMRCEMNQMHVYGILEWERRRKNKTWIYDFSSYIYVFGILLIHIFMSYNFLHSAIYSHYTLLCEEVSHSVLRYFSSYVNYSMMMISNLYSYINSNER